MSASPGVRALALGAAVLAALGLSTLGLDWGLPDAHHFQSHHGGESRAVGVALQMDLGSGELEPRWNERPFFKWGSHALYAFHVALWVGDGLGLVEVGGAPPDWERADFARAHLVARAISVAYLIGTVLLAHRLARLWYGPATAALAAWLVATCPLLVYESHFATSNPCLTFWCLAAVGLAWRAAERGTPSAFALAGAAAGAALGAKLSALPLLAPAAVAVALAARSARAPALASLRLGASWLGGLAAGFVLVTPYVLVRPGEFVEQALAELLGHGAEGHGLLFVGTGNGLVHLLGTNLPVALGWAGWSAALLGLAVAARNAVRSPAEGGTARRADLLVLAWLVASGAGLALAEVRYLRYLMPLCPFLALLAARALAAATAGARRPATRRAAALAAGAVVLWSSLDSLANVRPFARTDPKDAALAWIHANVPAGSSIGFLKRPSHLTTPVHRLAADPFGNSPPDRPVYREVALFAGGTRALAADPPEWIVVNRLELREEQRLGDRLERLEPELAERVAQGLELWQAVGAGYEPAATFENPVDLLGGLFDRPTPPRGWNAATQTVEVWRRAPSR